MSTPPKRAARPRRAAAPRAGRAASPDRGEHAIELAGVTYLLRPSHGVMQTIEIETGHSLLALLRMAHGGDLTLEMIGIMLAELIRAGADAGDQATQHVSPERIGELAYEQGLPRIIARLAVLLADVVSGGRDAAGNAKAAPTMMSEGAGAA
ncbi:hypothetical protein [uncultured Sphingomonas sp.]|uniref:GTA-gp10 family protein n=1 Tax=uncultured Sphingomonas sp. TaxID=158754 RepID=UPI00258E078B|nr:hypothetical protein [uncultured Sphingomonas sp.]